MGGKGSGRKKTPPRSNEDPNTLTENELLEVCFGKPLSERLYQHAGKRIALSDHWSGDKGIREERMLTTKRGARKP